MTRLEIMENGFVNIENKTLDELVNELYYWHPTSENFHHIGFSIENLLQKNEKYNEDIIVFNSQMQTKIEKYFLLNEIRGIFSIDEILKLDLPQTHLEESFGASSTFAESLYFEVAKRHSVEFNPTCKQLVTAAVIMDDENLLVLHTNDNNRIKNKYTLVQGHVTWQPAAYFLSKQEFLSNNLFKEVAEEMNVKFIHEVDEEAYIEISELHPELKLPLEFINGVNDVHFISDYSNHIGIEHFGFMYTIKIDGLFADKYTIESNEPDKHSIVSIPLNELEDRLDSMDNWLRLYVEKELLKK